MEYRNPLTEQVVEHIKSQYGVGPDFLWKDDFDNGAFRHPKTKKWFAVLMMNIAEQKVTGEPSDRIVDIINFKSDPAFTCLIVDRKKFFGGYHMNKENWVSIILDGRVNLDEIKPLVDYGFTIIDERANKKKN